MLLNVTSTTITFASFDVLMFRNKVDTFALAINYLNESWTLCMLLLVCLRCLTQQGFLWAMVRQLEASFEKFEAMRCVFAFVKDKNSNLTSMATTLHSILNCHPLKLQQVYEGSCYKCYKWWQGCWRFEICNCEESPNQFAKNNHMDKNKLKKRGGKSGEGMCWKWDEH